MSVLLVESDRTICEMVRDRLAPFGIQVVAAGSVTEAVHVVANVGYDVVIIELELPDGSGLAVLDELERCGSSAYVFTLSEVDETVSRALALERGADEYVVKPFHLRELTSRVLAVGRRRDAESERRIEVGTLRVDLDSRQVELAGRAVHVTAKEFDLLAYLAARPGHVFSRAQLLAAVWNSRSEWQQEATVTEHVRRLRAKVEIDPANPLILRTIRGVGYRLDAVGCGVETDAPSTRPKELSGVRLPVAPTSQVRQLLTGVLSEVADSVIITDLHRHIRSWNDAAQRLYGWSEGDVLGRNVIDVLQASDEGAALRRQWAAFEEQGRWHGVACHARRDGIALDVLATTTLVCDDDGEPFGIVSVIREIDGHTSEPSSIDPAEADDILRGIDAREFVVHYQPIIAFTGRLPIGVEALVRWQHPTRGLLAPDAFLSTAERTGSIITLGDLVLHEASRQVAHWRTLGADVRLSVNVSARQLADSALLDSVAAALEASGLDPAALSLEVTESALVEELDRAAEVLDRIVALGARVSIDDFGTGWASLTYLRRFPVHELKIDRSFVAGAGRNAHDNAIIRSVVSLGAELGLDVVAEGIETARQERSLVDLGCPLGQGYLYGRPVPAEAIDLQRFGRRGAGSTDPTLIAPRDGPSSRVPHRSQPAVTDLLAARAVSASVATERIEGAILAAFVRGLLRADTTEEAIHLFREAVHNFGGAVTLGAAAGPDALTLDVALGNEGPHVVEAPATGVERRQLERLVPFLLADARAVVTRLERAHTVSSA
jgi:PAS domain S-box-containing protein